MSAVTERALAVPCAGDTLLGILSLPSDPAPQLALVIVVGGPQYRAGSHRLFVQLARAAGSRGIAALRFDVRGMGDSTGATRSFEQLDEDIAAALDGLQRACPSVQRVVLFGLCDGASAALMYLDSRDDRRVAGLCLLNPWIRSAETQARTNVRHYYGQRLQQREFWVKVLSGRVALAALSGLVRNLWMASGRGRGTKDRADLRSFQLRMADGWARFDGQTLLALSGNDFTAKEFEDLVAADDDWQRLVRRSAVERLDISDADHTLSAPASKAAYVQRVLDWIDRRCR